MSTGPLAFVLIDSDEAVLRQDLEARVSSPLTMIVAGAAPALHPTQLPERAEEVRRAPAWFRRSK